MSDANLNVINEFPILTIGSDIAKFIVNEEKNTIQLVAAEKHVVINNADLKLITVGTQGPQGIQGEQGPQGIQGEQGIPGDPGPPGGGLAALVDDPDPHLGGDLILGPYNIVGLLENLDFVVDGGLL